MARFEQIGRRAWLGRMAGGFLAGWAGLNWERGRETWVGWLGWGPSPAAAQAIRSETIPVEIELRVQVRGFPVTVAAFIVVRGEEIAIIDTLVGGRNERSGAKVIGSMIEQVGLGWGSVRHVILTHWHGDHAGGADRIAALAPHATVWAGALDIPEIPLARPLTAAHEGDEIFGLRIIETPGHTAGHISVFDPAGSTLMTGDAVFHIGGELALAGPVAPIDLAQVVESIRKLSELRFERALFAHGPEISTGAAAQLAAFAAQATALPDPSVLIDHRHNCLLHAIPHTHS
jgi:glyoxylase-like metal-dependent hydrolase (beta-lactamase superfamily II)